MRVPLLDLPEQLKLFEAEVKNAVNEVIESGAYIMGPQVTELEKRTAEYCGSSFGIALSSGTDALLVALMALEVGPGDLVLTTPYSFFATAGVISRLNATPVFIDIDRETFNIDPDLLGKWFETNSDKISKVKAIIPVHLYGQCAEMDRINEIASRHNIPVIEDAAQAIGATCISKGKVRKAGTMSLAGCFSFFPTKNLGGFGDAGLLVTDDEDFAVKVRRLRNHGAEARYYHSVVGGNFRMDTIQAAVLLVKLPFIDRWHQKRRENAAFYDQNLKVAGLINPVARQGAEHHIYNQYVILVKERRDELRAFLTKMDIANEVYYPLPFHQQDCFAYLGYKKGDFPNSEYASEHSLALPIYPELSVAMQEYVVKSIKDFYQGTSR